MALNDSTAREWSVLAGGLRQWGLQKQHRPRHPKAQGRPLEITAPNVLWQTDLTSVWCRETAGRTSPR